MNLEQEIDKIIKRRKEKLYDEKYIVLFD